MSEGLNRLCGHRFGRAVGSVAENVGWFRVAETWVGESKWFEYENVDGAQVMNICGDLKLSK